MTIESNMPSSEAQSYSSLEKALVAYEDGDTVTPEMADALYDENYHPVATAEQMCRFLAAYWKRAATGSNDGYDDELMATLKLWVRVLAFRYRAEAKRHV